MSRNKDLFRVAGVCNNDEFIFTQRKLDPNKYRLNLDKTTNFRCNVLDNGGIIFKPYGINDPEYRIHTRLGNVADILRLTKNNLNQTLVMTPMLCRTDQPHFAYFRYFDLFYPAAPLFGEHELNSGLAIAILTNYPETAIDFVMRKIQQQETDSTP